ncbi:hypothetical protein OEZ85_005186 [Tetradesmus obliquus]|uniref:Tyrosine-protein kinase ephrin type A/B receptor-like domain-containing protein n=1 Tax=Tetradesmus obliquus TaxID=3088 RepID=A0ABY8UH30_TETOB|nr:hypothetical protein OEZ85_005186 [Tetradesmus obliquus]
MKRRRFGCAPVWALWLLLVGALQDQLHVAGAGRALAQGSNCPVANCSPSPSACIFYRARGWRCLQCANGFASFRNGMQCVCPAGQFNSVSGCAACPLNMYCPLGANPVPCPNKLITKGTGAGRLKQRVNPPGFRYVPSVSNPTMAPCGKDTYSLGQRFQTECTPCPSGFATSPNNALGSHTSVAVCIAPPGFLMISSMVAPCGKGTFSSSYSDNYVPCTKCSSLKGAGITTESAGAASVESCTWVEPGFAAVSDKAQVYLTGAPAGSIIAAAKPCPQDHYCTGGSPFDGGTGVPTRCPGGLRTQYEGAFSADQCVAPPGFYNIPGIAAVAECPDGWYKETWDRSSTCLKCGMNPFKEPDGLGGVLDGSASGWRSNRNVTIDVLDPSFGTVMRREAVRGSPDCCYLRKGMASQRVFEASTGIWRLQALYCPTGDSYYGLSNDFYGVALIPCFNCLPNMVTSCAGVPAGAALASCTAALDAAAAKDENGVVKAYGGVGACVLQPGWGWVNMTYGPVNNQVTKAFVQPCPVDTFSQGGAANLNCTPCSAVNPTYTTKNLTGQVACTAP